MEKEELFITLPNDFYNNDLSNEEIITYALIQKNYNKPKGLSIISFNMIKDFMYLPNRNDRLIKKIKNSINNLIYMGYIENILDLHYEEIELDILKPNDLFYIHFPDITENYFCVNEKSLDDLFKYLSNTNINKFSLARYYIAICRVINNDSCFGYLTQNSVKKIVEWGKTATSYNKILKNLGLIIYNNDFLTKEKHYCTTFFSLPKHEINFTKQLQQEVQRQGLIKIDKTSSNIKRSLTQKKNKAIKENLAKLESIDYKEDNIDVDFKEIKEMNDSINTYNKNKAIEKANKVFDKVYSNLN